MNERTFPVLWQGSREHKATLARLECHRVVPWEFVSERAAECMRFHGQSPERLAERGGLAPEEILVVLERAPLTTKERIAMWYLPPEQSVPRLKDALAAWESAR